VGPVITAHDPHSTLVYSMTKYDARIQAAMKEVAGEMSCVTSSILRRRLSGDDARNSGEVAHRDDRRESRRREQRAHHVRLIDAMLNDE